MKRTALQLSFLVTALLLVMGGLAWAEKETKPADMSGKELNESMVRSEAF